IPGLRGATGARGGGRTLIRRQWRRPDTAAAIAPGDLDLRLENERQWEEFKMRLGIAISALLVGAAMSVSASQADDKKTLAFVVNGGSDFWKIAEAGVKKAQEENPDFVMELKYPEQAAAAIQQRLMDDLVAAGVSAIMVSAVDPKTSTEALDRIASQVL